MNTQEWIAGLYGKSIFNFGRNDWAIFQNGCNISHSHNQCMIAFFSACAVIDMFYFFAILMCSDIVVLMCVSLMANNVEKYFHVFICHLYIPFGEMSVNVFSVSVFSFLIGLFIFLC